MIKQFLIYFTILLGGCSIAPDGDLLYMKTQNSYHPIYVRGNPNADTYILWVHGGPGSSGLYYGDMEEVAQLHKKYRVVYWDQLSSGGTFGTPDASEFTISNFAEHVQGILNIVQKKYKPRNMFLLGHSWGGLLSAYYLIANGDTTLSQKRQRQFKGFINLNPVWDVQDTLTNGTKFVTNFANEQIAKGKDTKQWKKILTWYKEKNGVFRGQDVTDHFNYVDLAGGMVVKRKRRDELLAKLTVKMVFNSPFEFYSYYDSQRAIRTYLDISQCSLVHSNKPNVSAINIPTLVMAGKMDKIACLEDTKRWYKVLSDGKSLTDFPLVEFEHSAHAIFIDEKDRYIQVIDKFISDHK
ncbi:MAG: alpha/beta fold hydrolase [Brevinema sp.]